MLITTTPSLIITLVIFTVMGFVIETHSTEHMADFAVSLKDTFTITPWLLIVPIVTGRLRPSSPCSSLLCWQGYALSSSSRNCFGKLPERVIYLKA